MLFAERMSHGILTKGVRVGIQLDEGDHRLLGQSADEVSGLFAANIHNIVLCGSSKDVGDQLELVDIY